MTRHLEMLIVAVLCAACSTEHLAQNVYEGIQNQQQAIKTPEERALSPVLQSFRDYEEERQRLKSGEPR